MDEPIEHLYFNWLYSKVVNAEVPTPSNSYYTLLHCLHSIEFVWLLNGDDNRAEDGLELRREFNDIIYNDDQHWMFIGCSVLEMLVAFSARAAFQTRIRAEEWFWIFLRNLGLDTLNDAAEDIHGRVSEAMDMLIWRTYQRTGLGGLFPLGRPARDQRKVEIWYQFHTWLNEPENAALYGL